MNIKNLLVFFIFLSLPFFPSICEASSIVNSLLHNQTKNEASPQIILKFISPKNKRFNSTESIVKDNELIKKSVEVINRTFILPESLLVNFSEGDGPYYDPNTSTITMNYDFILYLAGQYIKKHPKASSATLFNFTTDAIQFFLYHEIAHALISLYHLPIVSNEEIAADNLAVILTLEYTDDGYNVVMNSAELFDILDQENEKYDEDELWDEHALDSQRFYNIICLTYGRYPEKLKNEAKQDKNLLLLKFIKEKGDFCIEEYQQQLKNWGKLLDSHMHNL